MTSAPAATCCWAKAERMATSFSMRSGQAAEAPPGLRPASVAGLFRGLKPPATPGCRAEGASCEPTLAGDEASGEDGSPQVLGKVREGEGVSLAYIMRLASM